MIVWLRVGEELCGVENGLLRAADVSTLVELQALHANVSRRCEEHLDSAHREADAVRAQADSDADAAVQAASEEAEALRLEAIESGREEGLLAALDEWHARRLDGELERAASLDRLRELIVDLVVSGVERIVGAEAVHALFSKALGEVQALLRGARTATLRVHESDRTAAEAALQTTTAERDAPISLVADASLSPGACIFESEWGRVDAGLQTQLHALRAAMARNVEAARIEDTQTPVDAETADDETADDETQRMQVLAVDR